MACRKTKSDSASSKRRLGEYLNDDCLLNTQAPRPTVSFQASQNGLGQAGFSWWDARKVARFAEGLPTLLETLPIYIGQNYFVGVADRYEMSWTHSGVDWSK